MLLHLENPIMSAKPPSHSATDVPYTESQGARLPRDIELWKKLNRVLATYDHSYQHILETWPAYVRRIHMSRFLAHYELFKKVIDLPGCIVELGVSRGVTFFTWAKLMETFCPGDRKRKIYGFDSFTGLQDFHVEDGKEDLSVGKSVGGYSAGAVQKEVEALVEITNDDNMVTGVERCQLVVGDIKESLPRFLADNPGLRISLLHFDVDLYEPTKLGLELLYPLVVKGGVIIFDEYGLVPWQGESNAVDEYFLRRAEQPIIQKFAFSTGPHGYFVK
jgi:hypothetical protein